MKVVIDRSRWLRGEGHTVSVLLRESDGKMCCLGQVLCRLGKTEDQLRGVAAPDSRFRRDRRGEAVPGGPPGLGTPLLDADQVRAKGVNAAMGINDNPSMPDDVRERSLTEILGTLGIELEFVDKIEPAAGEG